MVWSRHLLIESYAKSWKEEEKNYKNNDNNLRNSALKKQYTSVSLIGATLITLKNNSRQASICMIHELKIGYQFQPNWRYYQACPRNCSNKLWTLIFGLCFNPSLLLSTMGVGGGSKDSGLIHNPMLVDLRIRGCSESEGFGEMLKLTLPYV